MTHPSRFSHETAPLTRVEGNPMVPDAFEASVRRSFSERLLEFRMRRQLQLEIRNSILSRWLLQYICVYDVSFCRSSRSRCSKYDLHHRKLPKPISKLYHLLADIFRHASLVNSFQQSMLAVPRQQGEACDFHPKIGNCRS